MIASAAGRFVLAARSRLDREGVGHRRGLPLATAAAVLAVLILGVQIAAGAAPTVTIEAASAVGYTTATAKGRVDPSTHETSYHFEVATQAQFESSGWAEASAQGFGSLAAGAGPTLVEASLEALAPATTYHLRLLAENEEGPDEAISATFETEAVARPTVSITGPTSSLVCWPASFKSMGPPMTSRALKEVSCE